MRLLRVFIAHEFVTQRRSARFKGLVIAYIVLTSAPAAVVWVLARQAAYAISASAYGLVVDAIQPLATALLAGFLAVDAIARERDEGSLPVAALAPVSAAGYVLRRWTALLAILAPVTLVPRVLAFGFAAQATKRIPAVAPFAYGWLVHAVPPLLIISALALALGTITGRTVLAILFGVGIFSVGLGIANDLLARTHRHFDGAADMLQLQPEIVASFVWALRGWSIPPIPTDAGYPLEERLELAAAQAALPFAIAMILLGISCAYLRRTRPDSRPWRVRDDHPLRSFLRTLNRLRDEYKPDGAREWPERIAVVAGIVIAIIAIAMIVRRYNRFERMATDRYAAEERGPSEMPATIAAESVSLRGTIDDDGAMQSVATLVLRNDGDASQARLGFALNAGVAIERLTASRGTALAERAWERVGVTIAPPLAPAERRTFTFALRGTPGEVRFSVRGGRSFHGSFARYLRATDSGELHDLSRSRFVKAVSDVQLSLEGRDLAPVPRYTPWSLRWEEMVDEAIAPASAMAIDLQLPARFTTADSCGTMASQSFASRCTFALADYRLVGARMKTTTIAPGVSLVYLASHESLARAHAAPLADAVALARTAWPRLPMPERMLFLERPSRPGERDWDREWPGMRVQNVDTSGAMTLIRELVFIRRKPLDRDLIAASLVASALRRQRRVVADQEPFFTLLYRMIVAARLGGKRGDAVIPATGIGAPNTTPILDINSWYRQDRQEGVFADIESRVGADRFIDGINDFVAAGGKAGTAKELLDTIAKRGGISLDRVYSDYFIGRALPKLTLADVTFTRAGTTWEVRGLVKNLGSGEVFCPIVLRTAYGSSRVVVRIDTNQSVPFVLRSEHEPRTLQLDPEKVVYRHAAIGTVDAVDYRGAQ